MTSAALRMNSVYNQRFRHFGTDFSGLFWREQRIELVPSGLPVSKVIPPLKIDYFADGHGELANGQIFAGADVNVRQHWLGVAGSLHVSFVPVVLQKSQKCVATNFPLKDEQATIAD